MENLIFKQQDITPLLQEEQLSQITLTDEQAESLPLLRDNINMSIAIDFIDNVPQTHIGVRLNNPGANSESARTVLIDTRFPFDVTDKEIINNLHQFIKQLIKLKNL
jgi:hypothetical protein